MALTCGIIGLPNVGKSTFFNALCERQVASENFPFCTIEPNIGRVAVPDPRLEILQAYFQAPLAIPSVVEVADIAGLVKGANKGEGLGNQFLGHIREVDALVHVVRCFEDPAIIHVAGSIDPVFDQEIIDEELRLADIASLEKRRIKIEKRAKQGDKEAVACLALLERSQQHLEANRSMRDMELTPPEALQARQWHLLTSKPVIYVANVAEKSLQATHDPHLAALQARLAPAQVIPLCIALEAQIAALRPQERQAYLAAYGLTDTGLSLLIQAMYKLLGLITYFTAGPKEARAWAIPKGTLAPQAAGVIHSDFEAGFIRAEVTKYQDYLVYTTEEALRQHGKIVTQGKLYEVQDGDVIHFRCNR